MVSDYDSPKRIGFWITFKLYPRETSARSPSETNIRSRKEYNCSRPTVRGKKEGNQGGVKVIAHGAGSTSKNRENAQSHAVGKVIRAGGERRHEWELCQALHDIAPKVKGEDHDV